MMKLAPPTQYLFGTDYPAEPMEIDSGLSAGEQSAGGHPARDESRKCGAAVAAAEIALVRTVLSFVVPSGVPQRIAYSGKPMNHPRLNDEEERRHFDDDEVAPSGKDSS
jgi:hypothetical protein